MPQKQNGKSCFTRVYRGVYELRTKGNRSVAGDGRPFALRTLRGHNADYASRISADLSAE